ncbi:MAG: PAS domain S-box protein [Deltaproteobacteria bacterium]|nr:PAS domain S-box protein [Deltaproteobacteria bacterium]
MRQNDSYSASIFNSLMESAPDGILVCDADGRIMLASKQCTDLLGYEVSELVGASIDMLVPESGRPKHAELRSSYMKLPRPRPMGAGLNLSARRKNGSSVPVEISLSGTEVDGSKCVIAIIRDVSDRRRLEIDLQRLVAELKRSNEELEQFAYIASHDLQEPLRVVSGYTQLLKRRYAGQLDDEAQEYIDFSVEGVKRMQALINDLLAYARLSTRGREFKPTDLGQLAKQTILYLSPVIEEAKAHIELDALPIVMGDQSQLSQVLQNLLSNALKFRSPERPIVIKISAARRGDEWVIQVADNGIGIAPEYRERIFVAFQRLHTRDLYPGNGIGLAICKKVIERHHGRIWVEPVSTQGTVFCFTLPVAGSQDS